jgi:hypothetical protein
MRHGEPRLGKLGKIGSFDLLLLPLDVVVALRLRSRVLSGNALVLCPLTAILHGGGKGRNVTALSWSMGMLELEKEWNGVRSFRIRKFRREVARTVQRRVAWREGAATRTSGNLHGHSSPLHRPLPSACE